MTKYEKLISEYDDVLDIEEHPMICDGLYGDNVIWINCSLSENRKTCILAEEIGHYKTSSGNILDLTDMNNAKQELKARKWAYNKLIPFEKIIEAVNAGCGKPYEFAEYLDLDEAFIIECLKYYGLL